MDIGIQGFHHFKSSQQVGRLLWVGSDQTMKKNMHYFKNRDSLNGAAHTVTDALMVQIQRRVLYLYGPLFIRWSALLLARMITHNLTSSRLPSIFEDLYFHCLPEDTDPTIMLVYTDLHWGRTAIIVTLRHRGGGSENVSQRRDGICHCTQL